MKKIIIGVSLLVLVALAGAFVLGQYLAYAEPVEEAEEKVITPPPPPPPVVVYGIPADDYTVHYDVVEPNEFFSNVLLDCNVPYLDIMNLVEESQGVFEINRKWKVDRSFTVLCSKDSIPRAEYLIYAENAIEYVVFEIKDSLSVYREQLEVETRYKTGSGTIESSLWVTMQENGLPPLLSMELADVFATTVNFFRLQKGDQFKVLYEERYVENEYIGMGNIITANFTHRGETFNAFYFEKDGIGDYFDENGNDLRRTYFLQAPLKYFRISSRFKRKRYHPVLGRNRPHKGTDFAAPTGTPIMATADGTVTAARYGRGAGNHVVIEHSDVYLTKYFHMSKFARGVKKGTPVRQGQIIGYVGSTGWSTGPHVHYEFHKNGKAVDPFKEKPRLPQPVKVDTIPRFQDLKDSLLIVLNEINYVSPTTETIIDTLGTELVPVSDESGFQEGEEE